MESAVLCLGWPLVGEVLSSLWPASGLHQVGWENSSGGAIQEWAFRRPVGARPARAKGSPLVSMCPLASGEFAGDLDTGDLGATEPSEYRPGAEVVLPVDRRCGGVGGGFDVGPAQVACTVLREWAAAFGLSGLVDPRAQAGVAAQLPRRGESFDVADFAGHGVAQGWGRYLGRCVAAGRNDGCRRRRRVRCRCRRFRC